MNDQENIFLITCGRGIMPYLAQEIEQLGLSIHSRHETGVEVITTLHQAMRLNLCLRTAYNVLYLLKKFTCASPQELYASLYDIAWEDIISPDEYVSIVSATTTPHVKTSVFASQKAKDAIVDRIAKACGRRPSSGPERANAVINLYWKDETCWIYLNLSGAKLADRSYRKIPLKAPLQETLAAALLLAAGYDGTVPLVNPMCGSGTIAIEAALIAQGRAPGLLRSNFGLMHYRFFDEKSWYALRKEVHRPARKISAPIIATDIDTHAIDAAKKNAQTAGVDQLIQFKVCDFTQTPLPEGAGIVMLNPPYGMRLGPADDLEGMYQRMGDFFKQRCAGYRGYIFTGNPALAKRVGLRTSRRLIFFNARIECRLLEYQLYEGTRKVRENATDAG